MPKIRLDFRNFLQPGAATIDDRVNDRLLGELRAAFAKDIQASNGALEKPKGWLRLTGLTATGYSMKCLADGDGARFPDHADYDLGLRWTIDVTYKPTTLPGEGVLHPIYWRADNSNNRVTTLEINEGGYLVFTHRDSAGTVVTVTSVAACAAGTTYRIRVVRFYNELRMFVDGQQSSTDLTLSTTLLTAAADNRFWFGCNTQTDGDTVNISCLGAIDEFRLWRDEILDNGIWQWSEYPWMADPRLVLYVRFNETTGTYTDFSKNGAAGTCIGTPTRNNAALVTALAPILKLWFLKVSGGQEQYCVWSNGGFYAQSVT